MRKRFAFVLALILCAALLCVGASASDGGGAWDGKTVDTEWYNTTDTNFNISTAEQLAGLASLVNSGNTFEDKTVTLTADIDLGGKPWAPIGNGSGDNSFSGTFDGGGYTISGLNASDSWCAGLFGRVGSGGTVKNLGVSGNVMYASYAGGIVGISNGNIENCYSSCTVTGMHAGGIVGQSSGCISNCYNTGAVNSGDSNGCAGGVVGLNYGSTVSNCYNTGKVSSSNLAGGVVGNNTGTVSSCFYLTGTADKGIGGSGGSGSADYLDDDGFSKEASFTGWSFDESSDWTMSGFLGRPVLKANNEAGSGVSGDPYIIDSLDKLTRMAKLVNEGTGSYASAHYLVTADIDMNPGYTYDPKNNTWTDESGNVVEELSALNNWTPIGTKDRPFTGTFDGNNHTIFDLYVDKEVSATDYIGLFGCVGTTSNAGTVQYLTVVGDINVKALGGLSSQYVYVGGIAGRIFRSNVNNCTFYGYVDYSSTFQKGYVGGVIGSTDGVTQSISNCTNYGNISGYGYVGGVLGRDMKFKVKNCYNHGNVTATGDESNAGGIVGYKVGTNVDNCDNYGNVTATGDKSSVGGIVGCANNTAAVSSCENKGDVTAAGAASSVGGIAGHNEFYNSDRIDKYTNEVTGCYNKGNVTAAAGGSYVGGLVGYSEISQTTASSEVYGVTKVFNCYNTGKISGSGDGSGDGSTSGATRSACVGGLVGRNYINNVTSGAIEVYNCYNTGGVECSADNTSSMTAYVGGLVGSNYNDKSGAIEVSIEVYNCYNTGNVNCSVTGSASGGVVGLNFSASSANTTKVANCYYLDTSASTGIGNNTSGAAENITSKTAGQFASGEVAWLLQEGQTSQVWGQTGLGGNSSLPKLTNVSNNRVYKVEFMNGETTVQTSYANNGGTISLPDDPTAPEGQSFTGWFTESTGGTQITGEINVTADTTYYARFVDETVTVVSVTLSDSTLTLNVGDTHELTAAVVPENATSKTVTWSTSNASVATVDENGVVTAVGPGTATITAAAGGKYAECTVTVRSSTGGGSVPDPTYKPVIDAQEDFEVTTDPERPKPGEEVTIKTEPEGNVTVTDKDGNNVDVTRNPDGTWTYIQPEGAVKITVTPESGFPFIDVPEGAWYRGEVEYVYFNGLMDGVSDTQFDPNGNMTRAMVWAILARMDGETVTGANWAETARTWAMASGISDGTDPNGLVTREQLATMLWRYAGEPASTYSLSSFSDASSVSDWAATAMAWAVENGVITGTTATTIDPQGTATRAQCAAMLMRFAELQA